MKDGSKLTITMNADACIDGTQDAGKAKMTMKGRPGRLRRRCGLKFELNVVQENVSEEVKKK